MESDRHGHELQAFPIAAWLEHLTMREPQFPPVANGESAFPSPKDLAPLACGPLGLGPGGWPSVL